MPAPPLPVVIRAATPRDGERVAAMAAALSRDEGGPPSQFSAEAFCRDGFGQAPAFACLIAERDGAAIGYALHYPDYNTDQFVHGVYLADLYVEKAARRAGVGRALMAAVARIGRDRGARMMRWGVLQHNGTARLFYSNIGREQQDLRLCSASGDRFRALAESAPRIAAIRPARPADAGALAAMLEAVNRELGCRLPRADIEAALRADAFGPTAAFACLVAEREEGLAGYALFLSAYDTETGARGTFLSDLYVTPWPRGHSLGQALIAATAQVTTQRGGDFLYWEVLRTNTRARRLYRSLAGELDDVIICIVEGDAFERLAADGEGSVPVAGCTPEAEGPGIGAHTPENTTAAAPATQISRPPPMIPPVIHQGIRYEPSGIGLLSAFDAESGARLWTLTVYDVKRDSNLEGDIQDLYFARMELVPGEDRLLIEDEARRTFLVDLKTRSVVPAAGEAG